MSNVFKNFEKLKLEEKKLNSNLKLKHQENKKKVFRFLKTL